MDLAPAEFGDLEAVEARLVRFAELVAKAPQPDLTWPWNSFGGHFSGKSARLLPDTALCTRAEDFPGLADALMKSSRLRPRMRWTAFRATPEHEVAVTVLGGIASLTRHDAAKHSR